MKRTAFARYVAFHEAGHAVANVVLFGGSKGVELWKEGRRTAGISLNVPDDNASSRKQSVVCYAGPIAHARYTRWSLTAVLITFGKNDWETIDECCAHVAAHYLDPIRALGTEEEFNSEWHMIAEHDARELVRQHWQWITRVANHLAEHGHMTGRQVKELRQ